MVWESSHFKMQNKFCKFGFMKIEKTKKRNLAIPGEPMSQEEFVSLIKEAEKGEFYTEDEFRKKFEEWKLLQKK